MKPLRSRSLAFLPALILCLLPLSSPALVDESGVVFEARENALPLVTRGSATTLLVDEADALGVMRAARDLQEDLERVTGTSPRIAAQPEGSSGTAVMIGTIGQSRLIDRLVREGKLDVEDVEGRWEAFVHEVIDDPLPGLERALVIAGSDRRGTIFGIYTLSEQIGVSPWYWWADVPVTQQEAVFVLPGRRVDAPVVQYRGIFLNDEAPALSGWAQERFGGFNSDFYAQVFELILRLRGNYLWPAMWGSAFNDDDPQNPVRAHEYGIVMGTSHHEPLMRAHAEWRHYGEGEWNYNTNPDKLQEFWRSGLDRVKDTDKIITIGMRGDGDEAMSADTNTALLEQIVQDQREIISHVMEQPAEAVPQVWALYKEVQDYYEAGMRVPDDVILLWADDNWGNIRRLPLPGEQARSGGAGVYYHFDYVGGPRSYKWINVTPLTKIWEQMQLAWQYQADRIWIVNVGDLKPMEFPIDYFLSLAWDPAQWPYERIPEFSERWAARAFGEEHATEAAALLNGYTKLNSRRRPEMIEPDTFSLVNYNEAERVQAEWQDLVERAEALNGQLAPAHRDAFFQLVLYPVRAGANLQDLYIAAGRNHLYALQGRSEAQEQADLARQLFAEDARLAEAYHRLNDGKWKHMMAQTNIGYTYWQQPPIEVMPAVSDVHPNPAPEPAIAIEGSTTAWPSWGAGPAILPPLDTYARGSRWVDLFNRGEGRFEFAVETDQPWLQVTPRQGSVEDTRRLSVSVDWSSLPVGNNEATVSIIAAGQRFEVRQAVNNPASPHPGKITGFIETDGHLAIEAPHFSRAAPGEGVQWQVLENFGRTLGAVTVFPVTAEEQAPGASSPHLAYELFLFSTGEVTAEFHLAPSLDFQSGEGLRFAVSLDDEEPEVLSLGTWETLEAWETAVAEGVRKVRTTLQVEEPGSHTLKFWMVTPGVVLQRIVIDTGGLRESYLGPQESPRGNPR